jgi:glycine/D-amino acid oxidase-like deaminating enzyme
MGDGALTRTVGTRGSAPASGKDYGSFSFWLETAGEEIVPRPPLGGPTEADVAILGAGFTGLWTAYYLLKTEPSLRVVVLEAETAGFGASGRNGAWCNAAFPVTPGELARRFGAEAARDLLLQMRGAVDEVGRAAEAEGIDAQFFRGGQLRVARGPAQVPGIEASYESLRPSGWTTAWSCSARRDGRARQDHGRRGRALQPELRDHPPGEARARARPGRRAPGRRDLRGHPRHGLRDRRQPAAGDGRGRRAGADGGARRRGVPGPAAQAAPAGAAHLLTHRADRAPLGGQWATIGWEGRECVASSRYTVDYLSRTADGRILFGGRGRPTTTARA